VPSDQGSTPVNNQPVNASQPSSATASSASQPAQAQIATLTSDALATNGLMAMADLNYAKAQDAFSALLKYYPQSEEAPVVRLELARLMFEQNQPEAAQKLIDEAVSINAADSDYRQIAINLKTAYVGR
jgi:outer membrane protein assembly factor BamD (BamD/ComL family)